MDVLNQQTNIPCLFYQTPIMKSRLKEPFSIEIKICYFHTKLMNTHFAVCTSLSTNKTCRGFQRQRIISSWQRPRQRGGVGTPQSESRRGAGFLHPFLDTTLTIKPASRSDITHYMYLHHCLTALLLQLFELA